MNENINYQVIIDNLNIDLNQYIDIIKKNNIKSITFLVNAPVSNIEYPTNLDYTYNDFNILLNRINTLKESNPELNINFGLISSYTKDKEKYLGELLDKVDFVTLKIPDTNLNEYLNTFNMAMESGIFDSIFGIENLYLYRNELKNEDRKIYDELLKKVMTEVIVKLNNLNLIINIDINNYPYSMIELFRIISYYHTKVLTSFNIKDDNLLLRNNLSLVNINNKVKNYNPKLDRLTNQKLSYIFNNRQSKSYSIYTEKAIVLLSKILKTIPKESEKEMVLYYINSSLDESISIDNDKANNLDKIEFNKINNLSDNKTYELNNIKNRIQIINDTLKRRIMLINLIKESVSSAFKMGASSPEDILEIVTYLIEVKTTNSESNKRILIDRLMNIEEDLKDKSGMEENVILSKRNPQYKSEDKNKFNWNSGIAKILSLSLILSFIFGFGIGVAYVLLKIN